MSRPRLGIQPRLLVLSTLALAAAGCDGDMISPDTDPYRDTEWLLVSVDLRAAPEGIVRGLDLGSYEVADPEADVARRCMLSLDLMFVGEWGWVEDGHRTRVGFMHELRPDTPYVSFYMDFHAHCRAGSEEGRLALLLDAIVEPAFRLADGADTLALQYGGFVEPGQTQAIGLPAPTVPAANWAELSFPSVVALDSMVTIPLEVSFTHWSRAVDDAEARALTTVTRTLDLHFRRLAVWRDRTAP